VNEVNQSSDEHSREDQQPGPHVRLYTVVIPTLNEEDAIGAVLREIPPDIWKNGEVIVVDASHDRTSRIASSWGARVIRAEKQGKAHQLKLGVHHAQGDILVMMDGDGEHPPEYIPRLIDMVSQGYDVALGTRMGVDFRQNPKMSIFYFVYLPFMTTLFKMAGVDFQGTPLTGFRCMRRDVWDKIRPESENFLLETEMNLNMGRQGVFHGEISIPFMERKGGMIRSRVLQSKAGREMVGVVMTHIYNQRVKKPVSRKINRIHDEVLLPVKAFYLQIADFFGG
jgi:glycosyltransferase involved in cell wall biosynthesis